MGLRYTTQPGGTPSALAASPFPGTLRKADDFRATEAVDIVITRLMSLSGLISVLEQSCWGTGEVGKRIVDIRRSFRTKAYGKLVGLVARFVRIGHPEGSFGGTRYKLPK